MLTLNQMVQVMVEPKNALLKQYKYTFALHDVDLHVTDEALNLIAEQAIAQKTGARGLRAIMERLLNNAMFSVPDSPDTHTVLVDAKAVRGEGSVLLLKGDLSLEEFLQSERDGRAGGDNSSALDSRVEEVSTLVAD